MSGAATKNRPIAGAPHRGTPVSALRGVTIPDAMGFADLWSRTLVYFGIAEEDDYWDEDGYVTNEELERSYDDRPNVRRLPRRRRGEFEDWTDSDPAAAQAEVTPAGPRTATREPTPTRSRRLEAAPSPNVKVHLVLPRSFNDAQQIADRFKEGVPVILNLQSTDQELSKRLIDFSSGLTYALNGGMQRVADKVFLLTPRNVEVSAEERARLLERGGFFNQA
jgi:cell division inhibitor SepF